jgi:polysaccharide pyruvyl transferase CsaB
VAHNDVLIAGYYGFGNTGDEAVLGGILHGLRSEQPGLHVTVVSANPQATQETYGVDAVLWNDIPGLVARLEACDLVLLGGGGLFHDYWGVDESTLLTSRHGGLPFFAGIPLLAYLVNKPCMLYAVGVGPLLTDAGRQMTRMTFQLCQIASVRDPESLDVLRELGVDISPERIHLLSDPAFDLPLADSKAAHEVLKAYRVDRRKHKLGVVIRHWDIGVESSQWESELARALDRWIEVHAGQVIFLPFQKETVSEYEDDHASSVRVVAKMRYSDSCALIEDVLPAELAGAVIAEFDTVLGMRLHSLIFALRAAKPALALAYDPKVVALMGRAGLSEFCLGLDQWNDATIVNKLEKLAQIDLHKHMQSHAKNMQKLAAQNVTLAVDLLKQPDTAPTSGDGLLKNLLLQKVTQQAELERKLSASLEVIEKHDFRSLTESITSADEKLQQLQGMIVEKDEAIALFSDQISENKKTIAEQEQRLESLGQTLTGREALITELSAKVSEQEIQIRNLREDLQQETQAYATQLHMFEARLMERNQDVVRLEHALAGTEVILRERVEDLNLRNEMIQEKDQAIHAMSTWIGEVKWSRAWRIVRIFWQIRIWFAPHGSLRERLLERVFSLLRWLRSKFSRHPLGIRRSLAESVRHTFQRLVRPRGVFAEEYRIEDYSQTTLYTDEDNLFPGYEPRRSMDCRSQRTVKVSLIATVRNAGDGLQDWLGELEAQARMPDEVVIVDGGSVDGTLEALQAFSTRSSVPFKVLSEPGVNIAHGRNLAIEAAQHEIIVCADFGSSMTPEYVERIVAPFEDDPDLQVVGGWYEARVGERLSSRRAWPSIDQIWPASFLPSARSMAYTKEAWLAVGRHPDWLTLTGDDTFFALELKKSCPRWAFVPSALVIWHAPPTGRDYWRKVRSWSRGDGETTVNSRFYWNSLLRTLYLGMVLFAALLSPFLTMLPGVGWPVVIAVGLSFVSLAVFVLVRDGFIRHPSDLIWETGAEIARVRGYLQGARQRPAVRTRRLQSLAGVFFILSGVPIDDTGGGARGTQIALELLNRQYAVVFIHRFPRSETVDLELRFEHPNLFNASLEEFRFEDLHDKFPGIFEHDFISALVEFPLPEFIPLMERVKLEGGIVIFDLLDDWNTNLGGGWYSQEGEAKVVNLSQLLISTEESLASYLQSRFDRAVKLVPNAVNHRLFNPDRRYLKPADMPDAEWTMVYMGALWGDWFDWDLLVASALAFPSAAVVVIGDYRGECPSPPENLYFLGLKPQKELPAYLAHSDVALIPWKVSPVTQATSPLKVYEYLAMWLPVVAPALAPLMELPGVFCAADQDHFISLIRESRKLGKLDSILEDFVDRNSWRARIDQLEEELKLLRQDYESSGRMTDI